jgi:hypothetical protein
MSTNKNGQWTSNNIIIRKNPANIQKAELSKTDKEKLDLLKSELESLKKEKVINYSSPEMARPTNTQMIVKEKKLQQANHDRMGVKDSTRGTDAALSGVASKYQAGKTRSGMPVHSYFDHPAHESYSEADHGDAAQVHRQLRDELKPLVQAGQTNPALMEHHQDAMMSHSKAQAQMRQGKR